MKRKSMDAGRLASELAGLPSLDREALIERWHQLYDTAPPAHISKMLLRYAVAYRMQEQVFGGLKPATRRLLAKVAAGDVSALPSQSSVKAGTRLLREWHGVTHEVIITDSGVLFQGKQYQSLSEVARIITGTRWSGPLFFGLKVSKKAKS